MSDEATRVNFSNLTEEVLSAVAMEPGDGVKLHFKNHINCPEANACLNHLATHRNHFIDDLTTVQGRKRLKQKIRGQYISPEKQKEVAERFLASQGRGCEWSSLEKKKSFVVRLLLKGGDRSTMDYIENLARNARVQTFFDGYEGDMPMTWNEQRAAESAGIQ